MQYSSQLKNHVLHCSQVKIGFGISEFHCKYIHSYAISYLEKHIFLPQSMILVKDQAYPNIFILYNLSWWFEWSESKEHSG